MATVRIHTTVKGFCLCHLLSIWQVIAKLCLYLGFYNVSYVPQQSKFVCGEQLYVHLMAVANLMCSLAYLGLSQRLIYDQLIFLLFVPLYIYFLQLRQHLTKLLNECAGIHRTLQRALGNWLCVAIRRECLLTLLLPLELLLLLGWQLRMYYSYQFCFIAGVEFIYYMELIFLGNYFIWLGSIYRALNEFLQQHMCSARVSILKTILRQHLTIWSVHARIIRYFALHLISFVVLIMQHLCRLQLVEHTGHQINFDRLQLMHLLLLIILLLLLLSTAFNLQQQQRHFQRNFLQLEDRLEYFGLKSWCLVRNQTQLMPFGLPIRRRRATTRLKRDVISMLFSCNLPASRLGSKCLPLTRLFCGLQPWTLTLPQLCGSLIKVAYTFLLALCLHTTHKKTQINFYSSYIQSNFDVNVTNTISQVYRWYSYDELE